MSQLRRELGLRDLVLFNLSALLGIRWLATAAHAGPGSITLWMLAAAGFFVPCAVVVSALSARWPSEGGLYVWTRETFGGWQAFLCAWLYWLSNLFFIPSALLFGVGAAAYVLPSTAPLAENRWYVLTLTTVILWAGVVMNVRGLRFGKWISSFGGVSTYLAGALTMVIGAVVWTRFGTATHLDIMPEWSWGKVNLWSQIAFAFTGLELGPVLAEEIRDPRKSVPRAAWISATAVTLFYVLGTAAILVLLEPERVSPLTGLAQTGAAAASRLDAHWLQPVLAVLVAAGVAGQVSTWIGGNARLPMVFGIDSILPRPFARIHPRWGTPHIALWVQGGLCTLFLALLQLGETLRAGYQLLVDMAVLTAFIPFMYIFLAGFKAGVRVAGVAGFAVSLAAAALSMVPPAGASSWLLFELKIAGGCLLLVAIARILYLRRR